jgi:hypothetical protein
MGVLGIPINSRVFAQSESEGSLFVRPADWLPIDPLVEAGQQKVVFLCAIFDQPTNVVSMRISGAFTVDWGDGSAPENFAAATLASKNFAFSSIPSGTQTTMGFRQIIVTVTPQAGSNLTSLNFSELPSTATGIDDWLNPLIDIKLSGSLITAITLNSNARSCFELAIFDWVGTNTITNFSNFLQNGFLRVVKSLNTSNGTNFTNFLGTNNLTSVPLFNTSNGTTFNSFLANNNLTSVPLFNTGNGTNFSTFLQNNNLTSVPLFNTSNGTNFGSFLLNNRLTSVPLFNTSNGTSFSSFLRSNSLTSVPLFNTSNGTNFGSFLLSNRLTSVPLFNTSNGTTFGSFLQDNLVTRIRAGVFNAALNFSNSSFVRLSRPALVEIFNNLADRTGLASLNINITGTIGAPLLTTEERQIATNKNWTITG